MKLHFWFFSICLLLLSNENSLKAEQVLHIKLSTRGNDISFDTLNIKAFSKEKISITFINEADIGSEILHNVAILSPGSLDKVFERLAKSEYDMDKFKNDPRVITISKELKPGEKETISFFPEKSGAYHYICLMPGHGDMLSMKGILLVEDRKNIPKK